MKKFMRRAAAAFTAAVLCASAASCSRKAENSQPENNLVGGPSEGMEMDEDEMPYGATMTSLSSDRVEKLSIDADFDPRFFDKVGDEYPEVYLAADYLKALQDADEAKMKELFYTSYLERTVKERNYSSVQEYLEKYTDVIVNKAHGAFEFTYFTIDSCYNEADGEEMTAFSEVDAKLDQAAGEALSDKVLSRKLVYLDVTLKDQEGKYYQLTDYLGYDISVYIYNIDGTYYLL